MDTYESIPSDEDITSAAARLERLMRREASPLRRLIHFLEDFFPLLVLTGTVIGALVTFIRTERGGTLEGDEIVAAGFLLTLLIVLYLNPRVQQYVQAQARNKD